MSSIRALLESGAGQGLPMAEAELLLSHCLGESRAYLHAWPERCAAHAEPAYRQLASARLRGEPVAYLLGEREFWSIPLRAGPGALIPRPETETLVEWALALSLPDDACVADLGTGTGAIAIALATERPGWRVLALENSPAALALAAENIRRHHGHRGSSAEAKPAARANSAADNIRYCNNRGGAIELRASDWYSAIQGERLHAIFSNPPYIAAGDPHLGQGDLRFEPHCALCAGRDGLNAIRRIIDGAPARLRPGGYLLLEHGCGQAAAARELLAAGGFRGIETRRDLAGHERISGGRLA